MARTKVTLKYRVNGRLVEVNAMDSIGVEDIYDIQFRGALHRIITGENLTEPAPREAKDWIIKTNLFI